MRECGCLSTTTLAQPRRPCRPRHPYAVPRTFLQCVCTRRRNCIGQLSPSSEYAPAARQINPNTSAIILRLVALCVWRVDPAPNDPGLLAAKGGAAGGGPWSPHLTRRFSIPSLKREVKRGLVCIA